MRELRKETEIFIAKDYGMSAVAMNIRNERTPKGDGNLAFLIFMLV